MSRLPFRHLRSEHLLDRGSEIPNCRALVDGLTPARNAARTAFVWPSVSEGVALQADTCAERRGYQMHRTARRFLTLELGLGRAGVMNSFVQTRVCNH